MLLNLVLPPLEDAVYGVLSFIHKVVRWRDETVLLLIEEVDCVPTTSLDQDTSDVSGESS